MIFIPAHCWNRFRPPNCKLWRSYRSRKLDVSKWVDRLRTYKEKLERDQVSRTSLEGVLLRLEQFSEGHMARQYGPSASGIGVEDLGLMGSPENPWGITVIEGGADMDEYSKAALLSLLASILYSDAVARRREMLGGKHFPPMQIFFEEANKVLTGVSGGAASDQGSGKSSNPVSHLFQTMWRDGRKYNIFLHLMAQTVSELPSGILSSCANVFVFQTKDPKDRDLILPHLGRSEKGLVNTEYKRYLARIPRTYAIAKLGYSDDVFWLEPVLVRPLIIRCNEPSDLEITQELGAVSLERTASDILATNPSPDASHRGRSEPILISKRRIIYHANQKTFPHRRYCAGSRHRSSRDRSVERCYSPDPGGGCQSRHRTWHSSDRSAGRTAYHSDGS